MVASDPPPSPNVVLIYVDDMATYSSVYGWPQVSTPNMERLAQRGVTFQKAYCPYPECAPSRASVFLGQQPHNTGFLSNRYGPFPRVVNGVAMLPLRFRNAGYSTGGLGKLVHKSFQHAGVWDEYVDFGTDGGVSSPVDPLPDDSNNLYWGPYLNGDGSGPQMRDTKNTTAF